MILSPLQELALTPNLTAWPKTLNISSSMERHAVLPITEETQRNVITESLFSISCLQSVG